ncbi:MAG: dimethyl sulfoxide reductase anchor subunit [Halobacteria archaeon]|nr:dimethyl sulfoxide reductase anchor subunit [Halobacteria archaeon]
MHPAFSVIFLTTLIGVGQGLFLALYVGEVYSLVNSIVIQDHKLFYGLGSLIALIFLAAGLIASIFHLGRPSRGWRAASQWRTSWLSREIILLPLCMATITAYGAAHYFDWNNTPFMISETSHLNATLIIGAVGTLLTLLLFVTTAMIYACLKFLQEWHSAITVVDYIFLGSASGFTLAAAFSAHRADGLLDLYLVWAVIFTFSGFMTRAWSLRRNARLRYKSSVQTAIGIRHSRIEQKAQGAMGGSFNTREFFHGRAPQMVKAVRYFFLTMTFLLPLLVLGVAYINQSQNLLALAFVVQYIGLMAERWYFFAEARHPQNLYYQYIS